MADKLHLDEVVLPINGKKNWLRRAIDSEGDVLDILVHSQRDKPYTFSRCLSPDPSRFPLDLG